GSPATAAITGIRNSTTWPTSLWARWPLRLRTRTWSTPAWARPITGRVRRLATGFGAPPMAASIGITWGWKTPSRLAVSWWIRLAQTQGRHLRTDCDFDLQGEALNDLRAGRSRRERRYRRRHNG